MKKKKKGNTCCVEILLVSVCRKGWGMPEGIRATAAFGLDSLAVGVPWACKEPHECARTYE